MTFGYTIIYHLLILMRVIISDTALENDNVEKEQEGSKKEMDRKVNGL